VRDQPPGKALAQRRADGRCWLDDIPEPGIGRRAVRALDDVTGPQGLGQVAVGAGQLDGKAFLGEVAQGPARDQRDIGVRAQPRIAAEDVRPHAGLVVRGRAPVGRRLVLEGVKGGILPRFRQTPDESRYPVNGKDLEVPAVGGPHPGGLNQVFRAIVADPNGVGRLLEQVDDRNAMQPQAVPRHHRERLQPPVERDRDLQRVGRTEFADRPVQSPDIEEQKPFLEGEILLKQPVARERAIGIGQDRFGPVQPCGGHVLRAEHHLGPVVTRRPVAHRHPLDVGPEQQVQREGRPRIAEQVEPHRPQLHLVELGLARGLQQDDQAHRLRRRRFQPHVLEHPRPQKHRPARPIAAAGSVDGRAQKLGPGVDREGGLHGLDLRQELEHAHRWDGSEIVGPQQGHEAGGQLRQLVVQLLPDSSAEEGQSFQDALDVGIRAAVRE